MRYLSVKEIVAIHAMQLSEDIGGKSWAADGVVGGIDSSLGKLCSYSLPGH